LINSTDPDLKTCTMFFYLSDEMHAVVADHLHQPGSHLACSEVGVDLAMGEKEERKKKLSPSLIYSWIHHFSEDGVRVTVTDSCHAVECARWAPVFELTGRLRQHGTTIWPPRRPHPRSP